MMLASSVVIVTVGADVPTALRFGLRVAGESHLDEDRGRPASFAALHRAAPSAE
jgi:hypothetical protein